MEAHHTLVVQSDMEGLLTALGAAEQGPVCEPERPRHDRTKRAGLMSGVARTTAPCRLAHRAGRCHGPRRPSACKVARAFLAQAHDGVPVPTSAERRWSW